MISKSYESAAVGGLVDKNSDEDGEFGRSLEKYAQHNDKKIIGAKEDLVVVDSVRESNRTSMSYGHELDQINLKEPLLVVNPFNDCPEKIPLTIKNYARLSELVRQMPGGDKVAEYYERQLKAVRYPKE